jgi:type I pantothenate kinase
VAPEDSAVDDPAAYIVPYLCFSRQDWAKLRANTPLTLSDEDLAALRSVNQQVSLSEAVDIFLPLSRLLGLHVEASRDLSRVKDQFLGRPAAAVPYVIAIAGSVAAGKSTFARVLNALIARWPDRPRVELVATDGFLYPNRVLEERGLMARKGFPESYDLRRMLRFLADLKAGEPDIAVPIYSHSAYDILAGEHQSVDRPDIVIFEGLNVLQPGDAPVAASDFFDFSVYVDAEAEDLESWFLARFLLLQQTAFRDPSAFFHRFKDLDRAEATRFAEEIWRTINLVNLNDNILPTRERASLILRKRADHSVGEVWLRRM